MIPETLMSADESDACDRILSSLQRSLNDQRVRIDRVSKSRRQLMRKVGDLRHKAKCLRRILKKLAQVVS